MPTFDVNAYANTMTTRDVNKLVEFYATDAEIITPDVPEGVRGREQMRTMAQDWFRMFDDLRGQVVSSVQEGDKVALLMRVQGTNTGDITISPNNKIPATGKRADYQIGSFITLDNQGKIKREVVLFDNGTIMSQLGVPGSLWAEEGTTATTGAKQPARR